jgi:uncharacterized lipoprotein YmbA
MRPVLKRPFLLLAGLLTPLLVTGCLGRSPETRLYTLGSQPRPVNATIESDLAILVGPARFPRYLERPQLVRRLAAGEVELDEFNRWAGGFEENVIRALALDVENGIGSDRVVAYPSDPPFALDYRIRIHFDELVVGPDDVLRMRARWSIRSVEGAAEALLGRTDLDEPVQGGSVAAVVEAHDRAIGVLGEALVAAIFEIEAIRAESMLLEGP